MSSGNCRDEIDERQRRFDKAIRVSECALTIEMYTFV